MYLGPMLLAVACLVGGVRPVEGALLVALAFALAGDRRPSPPPVLSSRTTSAVVGLLTLWFILNAAEFLDRDRPLGTDWMAYLKNAVALAEDEPRLYQRWRGPVHAWACLLATQFAGDLVAGSQWVSFAAAVACVPLTAWVGTQLGGPYVGITAAVLLAGWSDLRLYAAASTPYPLVASLSLLGGGLTWRVATQPRGGLPWLLPAVAVGLSYGADLRAGATALATGLGSLRRGGIRVVFITLFLGFALGSATIASLPVDLIPLREQMALQRDLNAREGISACPRRGAQASTWEDLTGRCGRTTLVANLARGAGTTPVGLEVLAALFLLGLVYLRGARLFLLLPLVPLAPGLLVIGFQHRYFLPIAPFFAIAGAGALVSLFGRSLLGRLGGVGFVLALGAGWSLSPGTLWSRATRPPPAGSAPDIDPAMSVVAPSAYVPVRAALRAVGATDRVVDCTRADLRVRLYPHTVETAPPPGPGQLSKLCRGLIGRGPTTGRTTWMLLGGEPITERNEQWEVVFSSVEGSSELLLLRAGPPPS